MLNVSAFLFVCWNPFTIRLYLVSFLFFSIVIFYRYSIKICLSKVTLKSPLSLYTTCTCILLVVDGWWLLYDVDCSLILDNERWRQADVPAEFQELVNHITRTGTPGRRFSNIETCMEIYVTYNVFFIKLHSLLHKVNWDIKFVGMLTIPDRTADSGNVK